MRNEQQFPRALRLLNAAEFDRVFAGRCSARGQYMQMLARPNSLPHARLGMIVGKKAAGNAVRRNFIRRTIREVFRRQRTRLPAQDYVVRIVQGFAAAQAAAVRSELDRLFVRTGKCREF